MKLNQIKRVNIFTQGDSNKPSTWSSVPYSFSNSIEKLGIQVNRIDILPENNWVFRSYTYIWDKYVRKFISRTFKKHIYSIDRSLFYRYLVKKKIKKAVKLNKEVDFNIFLTYSYTNNYTKTPSLLLCDYTYEYFIEHKLKRKPNLLEKTYIRYEKKMISKSEIAVCLFSAVATYMNSKYNKKTSYLGRIGLNIVSQDQLLESEGLVNKKNSNYILFVGNWTPSYYKAAKLLIDSFQLIKELHPNLELYIVGMNDDAFKDIPPGVKCYGYLNKGNDVQRKLYYDLLLNAKIFVNTSGSYCATVEAMYYYTPIITSKYDEFVNEFGNELSFGQYCNSLNKNTLKKCILNVLNSSEYKNMCISAHNTVAQNTWGEFSKRIIDKMNNVNIN